MPKGVYKLVPNRGGRGQEWPDAVIQTLLTQIPLGASAAQLVKTLKDRHGYTTTRNAIIGKAHRLGLSFVTKMKNEEGVRDALNRRKQDRRLQPKPVKPVKPVQYVEEKTLLREDGQTRALENNGALGFRRRTKKEIEDARKGHIPAIVESAPRSTKPFAELKHDECKWPTAIDASMACGRKATCGAYCDAHASIAYRTPPTRKRHATIRKEQDIDAARRRKIDADAEATIAHFLDSRDVPGISDHRRSGDDLGLGVVDAFITEVLNDDD